MPVPEGSGDPARDVVIPDRKPTGALILSNCPQLGPIQGIAVRTFSYNSHENMEGADNSRLGVQGTLG